MVKIMKILIIGARGGIAYKTALLLVKKKHTVYLGVHTEEEKKSLLAKINREKLNLKVLKIDITNKKDLKQIDKLNYDILWSHAGIGNGGTLLAMDIDVLKDNYNVNVFGTIEVVQRAYNNFKRNNRKGKIFVTSSLAAYLPFPYLSCYTSSKAALSMLITTMNKEIKKERLDISLILLELGAYNTGFNEVMIDNKEKFLDNNSIYYKDIDNINRLQKNLFTLIEKDNYDTLAKKIVKEMEKKSPRNKLKTPLSQVIFTKVYSIFK